MEHRFHISCDQENARLDTYLSEKLSLTRTKAKRLIEEGHIRIAGKVPKASLNVRQGMAIEGEIPEEEPLALTPEEIPLVVLYEDRYLLAVDKAKGMVVHPSLGHQKGTLVNAILSHIQESFAASADERPGIVHRLDKDTTGVILVAKDPKTQEALSRQFHERSIEKVYRAVVEGVMRTDEGTVEGCIGRDPRERKRMAMVSKGGRHSFSRFRVIKRLKGFSYVEVYPETGRTHQIRVHLAHIGHAVVGDPLYGRKGRKAAGRPLLHAFRITFEHPVTGKALSLEAPVPEDMERFLNENAV